jgi:hypothetical protein
VGDFPSLESETNNRPKILRLSRAPDKRRDVGGNGRFWVFPREEAEAGEDGSNDKQTKESITLNNIWKRIIDAKYHTRQPNILCCHDTHPSIFWKGVMWDNQAAKVGYKWSVGDGKQIKF